MVKCPFCHFENEDGALFCEQCKSDLAGVEAAAAPMVPAIATPIATPVAEAVSVSAVMNPITLAPEAMPAYAVPVPEVPNASIVNLEAAAVAFPVAEAAPIPLTPQAAPAEQAHAPLTPMAEVPVAPAVEVPAYLPPESATMHAPLGTATMQASAAAFMPGAATMQASAPGLMPSAPTVPSSAAPTTPSAPATPSPAPAASAAPAAPAQETGKFPTGGQPRLLVLRGLKRNVEYPLYEGVNFIGRADEKPVDIDLEDQEPPDRIWSSRQHAVITFENEQMVIEDLNSSNGTFVNRTRIPPGQPRPLNVNDVVQIGTVQMKVIV